MKQTNNAIKFLMAQYRAIFKNAYFKGIASAVLLTAGLAAAGNAQAAATKLDAAAWENLPAEVTVSGKDSSTAPEYTNIEITETKDHAGTTTINITASEGASTSTIGSSTNSAAVNVTGANTTVNFLQSSASNAAKLTVEGKDASNATTFDVKAINITKGELAVAGFGTVSADTISLQAADAANRASAKISFTGADNSKANSLVGKLTTANAGGTLDFSTGFGTLKTYTDANGVDVDITVVGEKGATLDLSAQTEEANKTMKLVGGKFDIQGGSTAGTFTVKDATLDIGADVNLTNTTSTNTQAGTLVVSGTSSAADATVRVDTTVLKNFLTASGDQAGSVNLTKGTLDLVGNELFDLATDVTFGTANTAGAITQGATSGDSVIKGTNLAVSSALSSADKVAIVADSLTLGKADTAATASLGFYTATARDLTLLSNSDTFTLANNVTLKAIDEVDNPFLTAEGTIKVAGNGQLDAQHTTISGTNAQLTIAAGHYSTGYNVTLDQGKLTVGNQAAGTEFDGVDASLKLTGTLSLDNGTGANTITIAGNSGAQSIPTDDPKNPISRKSSGVLDLTDAEIAITRGSQLTTIHVNAGGELLVSSEGFRQLVNAASATGTSGAATVLSGGSLFVDGSIQGENNKALSAAKLKSGASATTDVITFSGSVANLVEASDTIWLADTTGSETLDISDTGTLKAQTFRLDGKDDAAFIVARGTLTAGTRVESSNGNAIQLGNGTSGATLNLGYIESDVDEWGQPTGTYTTSSATGSVTTDLTLAGSGSAVAVNYGAWTSTKNITLSASGSSLTIGDTTQRQDADGKNVVYDASLSANKLTLGHANATTTVNTNGTATLNELAMTDGTLNVYGTMTVNGKFVKGNDKATPPTTDTYGVAITGGDIKVSGRNANLIFGEDAVKAITLNAGKAAVGNNPATPASVTVASGTFTNNISVDEFGLLTLNFAKGTTFNADSLKSLRQALLDSSVSTNGSALEAGYINLGAATIDGVHVSKQGTIDWANLKDFADIDQLKDIVTDDMASATLINVNGTDTVTANVANIQLDGNQQTVNLGDAYLADANGGISKGNFVFNEDNPSQAGNANVTAGAHVTLANGGNIGSVSLAAGNNAEEGKTIFNVIAQDPNAVTNIQELSAGDNTLVNISGTTEVAGRVNVDDLQADAALTAAGAVNVNGDLSDTATSPALAQGSISAASLTVDGKTNYSGDLDITGRSTFNDEAVLEGNNNFADTVTFVGKAELSYGTTNATTVNLDQNLIVDEGATLNATLVEAGSGQTIFVGQESSSEAGYVGDDSWESSTGYFFADRVDLNGAYIMVDPAYGKAASMVCIGQLGDVNQANVGNDAGTLEGGVVSLRNAITAIGVNDTNEATVREQLQSTFAQYLDANGSLSNEDDGIGSILYVAESLNVNNGSKLIVDADKSFTTFNTDRASTAANSYGANIRANDVYIGSNSALAIGDNAALNASYNDTPRAALEFQKNGASLYAEKGAQVLLVGSGFSIRDNIRLFDDLDNDGILINGNNVTVSTMNGLLTYTLEAGKLAQDISLSLNRRAVDSAFYAASAPVKNTLITYAANDLNWADTSADHEAQQLLGDRVTDVEWNGTNYVVTENETERNLTPEESADLTHDVVGYDANDRPVYGVFEKGYNYFLDQVVRDSRSGAEAETVARLAVFGGAAQAAISAGASTYDAVSGRMGVGANGANITVADNTQGAALWLAPIYKSSDSDGFDAEGVDYGVDMDLYGVALGADYTLSNGIRFGAMFNVGSGEVDGQGAGSAVSNDFDYYGFAVYGGYSMGALSVVADVSYTVADNDLEGNTSIDKVGASLDSTNLSIGVTGQYQLDFNGTTVTPHAGLRFSRIDLDDYTIDGEDIIADYDADSMNIFSIPVGVTFAKEFTSDTWTVKPSLDLTLTGNFGDDETDGTVHWAGVNNLSTNVSSEVVDNFTYGATLGVAAKTGNFSLGLGVNYTGSSNVDEFGVQANARFVF